VNLERYGWSATFVRAFAEWKASGHRAGRAIAVWSNGCRAMTELGEVDAALPGRAMELAVGDWLALEPEANRIAEVLPRKTVLARRQPGQALARQVLAANLDVLLIVTGVDGDFSLHRIERYLVLAEQCGAEPAIVLSKADLLNESGRDAALDSVRGASPGVPVVLWSAWDPTGPGALSEIVQPRRTAALVGSSGVGKSTIVNVLLGREALRTQAVREDDSRGRHTTTHRELFLLPQGWLLIDMPGMREVALWADEDAVEAVFDDLQQIAAGCRFRDCTHRGEPGCAVAAAVERGDITPDRVAHFHQLRAEVAATDELARKRRDRVLGRSQRQLYRRGPKW